MPTIPAGQTGGYGYGQPGTGGYPQTGGYAQGNSAYPGGSGWAQPGTPTPPVGQAGGYGYGQSGQQGSGGYQTGSPTYPGGTGWTQPNLPAPTLQARTLLDIANSQPVTSRPEKGSKLDLQDPHVITLIRTYHWNDGRGAAPGSIGLRCRDGRSYGPWQAIGEPSKNGVPNAYWAVYPNVAVSACVCAIVDSDPATWSQNDDSKNRGFARIEGYPSANTNTPYTQPGRTPGDSQDSALDKTHDAVRKMDETKRALESLKGIFK